MDSEFLRDLAMGHGLTQPPMEGPGISEYAQMALSTYFNTVSYLVEYLSLYSLMGALPYS